MKRKQSTKKQKKQNWRELDTFAAFAALINLHLKKRETESLSKKNNRCSNDGEVTEN